MSYCRWSSENFACDVYAYEHVAGGWTIHLAGNRVVGEIPAVPPMPGSDLSTDEMQAWARQYREASDIRHKFLMEAQREDIELPHAGGTIDCGSLQEFRDKMLELRGIGYRFPDRVFETIDQEMALGADA